MKRIACILLAFISLCHCVSSADGSARNLKGLSPCALAATADGLDIYIAEYTANQIVKLNLASGKIIQTINTTLPPTGLALGKKTGQLYVTLEAPKGQVVSYMVNSGEIAWETSIGNSPLSPVLSSDDKTLAVCNRFSNSVSLIDAETGKEKGRVATTRQPIAAAFTPDGSQLLVANHLPAMAATDDHVGAEVSLIDPLSKTIIASVKLENGATGVRGVCTSPDGLFAYITHTIGRYQVPTTQIEKGWINTNAMTVIDLKLKKPYCTIMLDDLDLGAANPWGIACTGDGSKLCVSHSGTHEISVINRLALHEQIQKIEKGEKVNGSKSIEDAANDLSFLTGIRQRIPLSGNGPRSVCVAGDKAVVANYFTDDISLVSLDGKGAEVQKLSLGLNVALSIGRKGEMLFNDAQYTFQKWLSCSTCHPDTRSDGLNWDLLNDGIGNPKNTKSLLLSFLTPPTTWTAVRRNAKESVQAGIRHIQFTERPEEHGSAIEAYLRAFQPTPSPFLIDGKLSEAAIRGKATFERAGCADCHTPPLFTDKKSRNMGLGIGAEENKIFDTPSLIECWRNAPYLHDGRAANLKDIFLKHDVTNKFGAKNLSENELNDLLEYVLSL
jgi:YVTN family beta-propeller protein